MENRDNLDWDEFTPPVDSETEMLQIQKSLRKRNWKIILTSLALGIALLMAFMCVAMPLAERLYWSPMDSTLDQYYTDLNLVLRAYTELFMPGKSVTFLCTDVGFADYELHMTLYDVVRDEDDYFTGRLHRGNLGFDIPFFEDLTLGLFRSVQFPEVYPEEALERELAEVCATLEELPEYVTLEAAVSFPEDLTMAQLMEILEFDFLNLEQKLNVIWAAIRTQGPNPENLHRTIGISFTRSYSNGGINETYPQFELTHYEPTGLTLEEHFKSLLKFSSDQMVKGHAVIRWNNSDFYQDVLAYVEENGVKTYGCIVTGSPKALLSLLDSGTIQNLQLMDAWIDVG